MIERKIAGSKYSALEVGLQKFLLEDLDSDNSESDEGGDDYQPLPASTLYNDFAEVERHQ